jgi:hypothetical protein
LEQSIAMTFQPTRQCVAAGVLAGVLALFGCGSDEEETAATTTPSPAQTATPEDTGSVPASLRGSWKRTLRARDWKSAGGDYPAGTWRFDVDSEGAVGVYYPRTDTVDFSTQFVVAGKELTIESIPICPGIAGRYRWQASADELTLTIVDDDDCAARAALFGGTWRRRR